MKGVPVADLSGNCSLSLSYAAVTTIEKGPVAARLRAVPNLTSLDLSGNRLATLPQDLSYLPKLRELNLTANLFTSLTTVLPGLKSLAKLRDLRITLTSPEESKQVVAALPLLERLNGRSTAPESLLRRSNDAWSASRPSHVSAPASAPAPCSNDAWSATRPNRSSSPRSARPRRRGAAAPAPRLRHPPPSPPREIQPQVVSRGVAVRNVPSLAISNVPSLTRRAPQTITKADLENVAVVMSAVKSIQGGSTNRETTFLDVAFERHLDKVTP